MTTAYDYRAARIDGALEAGVVEASSREAASAVLAQRGLFPTEITLRTEIPGSRARLSADDQALGLRMLATLLEAGLPMNRALAALDELAPPAWRAGLPAIRDAVREGRTLASALGASGLGLPPVVLGLVHAGEAGSGVAPAVRRAAELSESAAATRRAIRGALAYPIVLATAGFATVLLLVNVVVPKFAGILADLGQELPASTQLVLSLSEWSRLTALPALLATGAILLAWRAWVGQDAGRRQWHAALLRIPLVGRARRASSTARTAAALSALLESGVPLTAAIPHAARASGDAALGARLLDVRESIAHGVRLSAALERHDAMTPTTIRLVRAGEESGRLAAMLRHSSGIEGERAEQMVRNSVRLLEPALILVFGAVVALVAAALMQAVYAVRPV